MEVISRHMIQKFEGMQCLHEDSKLQHSAWNIASFAAGKEVLLEIMEPDRDHIYQEAIVNCISVQYSANRLECRWGTGANEVVPMSR